MRRVFIFVPSILRAVSSFGILGFIGSQYGQLALGQFYLVVAWFSLGSIFLCFGLNNFFVRFSRDASNQTVLSSLSIKYLLTSIILFGLYFVLPSVWLVVAGFCFVKASYLLVEAFKVSKNQYADLSRISFSILLGVMGGLWLSKGVGFTAMEALATTGLWECVVLSRVVLSNYKSGADDHGRVARAILGPGYARSLWVVSLLNASLFSVDRFILEEVMSTETVAIYGTLMMVFMIAHRFFTTPYLTWRSREFYRSQDRANFFTSAAVGGLMLTLGMIVLNYLAPSIFQFLGVVSPSTPNLHLAAVNTLLLYIYTTLYSEFKNNMNLVGLRKVTILLATSSVMLNLIFVPNFGITGALSAFLLAYLIGIFYLVCKRSEL